MNDTPNYYAIIPANVRYCKELNGNEKLLYGEITALSKKNGYCYASNNYFANLYSVSKVTISKWIANLIKQGFIKSIIVFKEGTKQIDKRCLTIVNDPIKEKLNTPIKEKLNTPIKEKFKDNNTSINNTSINKKNKTFFNVNTHLLENQKKKFIWKLRMFIKKLIFLNYRFPKKKSDTIIFKTNSLKRIIFQN